MDDRSARSVRERARLQIGGRHGEERTSNMERMSVTLEVSKLSGWLNANAFCRKSKEGHAVRGEVYTGRGAAGGGRPRRQAACRRGRGYRLGAGEEHTPNM